MGMRRDLERASTWVRRGWWTVPALVAAAGALVLLGLWWTSLPQSPPPTATAGTLLGRVRNAPAADLPLRERLELERNLLKDEEDRRAAAARERSAAYAQALGILLQVGTAALAGWAGIVAWRNLVAAQEGQVTTRYTQAVAQLGAELKDGRPNLEVRVGGIYALGRIAADSERDHWPVMEVLTAYVRQNAPWLPQERPADAGRTPETGAPQDLNQPRLREDIAAVVSVLRLRRTDHERLRQADDERRSYRLLLQASDLRRADFGRAPLRRAYFADAQLDGAYFVGAQLSWALFQGARLREADFSEAQMEETNFSGTRLEGATFSEGN